MADITRGWDTKGVTGWGILSDGRFKLEFTGVDGRVQNVFVPGGHVSALISLLASVAPQIPTDAKPGTVSKEQLLQVRDVTVAVAEKADVFVVEIKTIENLPFRFVLDTERAQALSQGLRQALERRGLSPDLTPPAGSTRQ